MFILGIEIRLQNTPSFRRNRRFAVMHNTPRVPLKRSTMATAEETRKRKRKNTATAEISAHFVAFLLSAFRVVSIIEAQHLPPESRVDVLLAKVVTAPALL